MKVFLPIKTVSESNVVQHWSKRHRRSKEQKAAVYISLLGTEVWQLPAVVTLTRHASRDLDSDNLTASLKAVRDAVADILIPGHRPGMADGMGNIEWRYAQVRCKRLACGVSIEINQTQLETS